MREGIGEWGRRVVCRIGRQRSGREMEGWMEVRGRGGRD